MIKKKQQQNVLLAKHKMFFFLEEGFASKFVQENYFSCKGVWV